MKTNFKPKLLGLLLVFVMVLSTLLQGMAPMTAMAAESPYGLESGSKLGKSGKITFTVDDDGVLTWTEVPGATSYELNIRMNGQLFRYETGLTSARYDLQDQLNEFKRDSGGVEIILNPQGTNVYGDSVIFLYSSPYPKLEAPTNLIWNHMIAKWDKVPHADGYTIYLYQKSGSGYNHWTTTDPWFDFSGVANPAEGWYFTVQANSAGNYRDSAYNESPRKSIYASAETFIIGTYPHDETIGVSQSGGKVYLDTSAGSFDWSDKGYTENVQAGTYVTVKAQPVDGYEFVEWRQGTQGDTISDAATYSFYCTGPQYLYAIFRKGNATSPEGVDSEETSYGLESGSKLGNSGRITFTVDDDGVLTWTEVPGATSYELNIRINGDLFRSETGLTSASYDLQAQLHASKKDNEAVEIHLSPKGANVYGDTVSFRYSSPYPKLEAPTNLTWTSMTADWDDVPHADEYTIYLYQKSGSGYNHWTTKDSKFDFSGMANPADGWYFTVQATSAGNYRDSEFTEGPRKSVYDASQTFLIGMYAHDATLGVSNGGGKVHLETSAGVFDWSDQGYTEYVQAGTYVTVRAQPADGYEFVEWRQGTQGDTISDEAIYSFYCTGPRYLYAIFRKIGTMFPEGAGSSAGNPAMCYSYEEFKYAMEDPNIRYVALGSVKDTLPLIPHDPEVPDNREIAIVVRGKKDLNLLGNATFTCPVVVNYDYKTYEELITLTDYANSDLYIHGAGRLTFEGSNMQFYNSVIRVQGGSLTVDGATVAGSHGNHTGYCYGINALYGSVGIQGGATIRGAVYDTAGIYAFSVGSEGITRSLSVSIWDGKFYVDRVHEGGYTDGGQYIPYVDYGICVQNDVGLRIYGGSFDGIDLGRYAADTLADYVMDGCTMTVNGVKTDPAICGTTDQYVEIFNQISDVNIHVNSPVAGESPATYNSDVYLVPEGATVESITWYENGQPWNISSGSARFTAGNTYKVEIVLTADDGVKFANPLTSATVNYKNATVSAFAGNPETGVVLTVDLGECPNIVPQVDLTVTAPKEGNTPSYTIGCGSDAYYAVGGSSNYTEYRKWYMSSDNDDWWEINGSHQFMSGYYYKLVVDIRTNEGYEFPLIDVGTIQPDVTATVNGYSANVIKAYDQDPSRYITVEYNFGECNDSVVENIIIENVTAPVAGEKPNYNWSIRGSGYQMDTGRNNETYAVKNGMQWLDVTGGNVNYVFENDTFLPGHEYQCTVYVVTENGFEFVIDLYTNPETWPTATVNSYTAEINRDWTNATEARVYYTFTCGAKTVDKVAITDLENPVGGNTPDTAVTVGDADSYTVERVEWFDIEDNPAAETFESGVPYYALITVAPASGAVFADADAILVTVNGSELDSVEIENGKLLIYVIIRKPASAPIVNPYAFITQPSGGTVNVGESLNVAWQTSFIPTSTEIQYWDGEAWDQWDIQYPQNALDDYDFESHEAASYRFRIVTYIGNDAVATSNEFAIAWEEAVAAEYIYVYSPGEGNGSNDFDYVTEGTQITLSTPESMGFTPIDGFTFDYWSIRVGTAQSAEVAQKQPGDQITIDDNTYIIAIWKEAPLTEYMYLYSPGEANGSNDFDYVTNGTEITLSTPESMGFTPTDGFTFDYWSIRTGDTAMNPEIAQKQPGDTIIINDDTYIIAIWKALPHECVGVAESGQSATCTVDGWKDYYRCECGKYYEDADCETLIPDLEAWKLGDGKTTKDHIPNADDGDCTTDITCTVCGDVTTEGADAHTGGTATCEKKAECAVCGKEYGELADHIPNADDGDCTTDITCTVCGDVTTEGADAHTGGTATCEKKAACTVCGKEYGELADHRFVEGKCECGETDPGYTPDTDAPDTDAPDTDVPGTDLPGTDKPEDPDDGLSGGAIAGIVAGSVVVLGGGGFALFWFVIKKKSFADLIAVFKKK